MAVTEIARFAKVDGVGAGNITQNFTGSAAVGDVCVVAVNTGPVNPVTSYTMTDNATGNTWTQRQIDAAASIVNGSHAVFTSVLNTAISASNTYTITCNTRSPTVWEVIGVVVPDADGYDQAANGGTAASSSMGAGTITTPAQNSQFLWASYSVTGTPPPTFTKMDANWTEVPYATGLSSGSNKSIVGQWRYIDAAGSRTATATLGASQTWTGILVSLNVPAGGAPVDYTKTPDDPTGVTDTSQPAVVQDQTVTGNDPTGVTDPAPTLLAATARTVADPGGFTDTAQRVQAQSVVPADTAGFTDTASYVAALAPSHDDPAGVTDVWTMDRTLAGDDPVGLGDPGTTVVIDSFHTQDDAAGVTDVMAAPFDTVRLPADPAGVLDASAAGLEYALAVDDPVEMWDGYILNETEALDPPDPVNITDTATVTSARALFPADTAGVLDDPARSLDVVQELGLGAPRIHITDSTSWLADAAATADDGAGLTDVMSIVFSGVGEQSIDDPTGVGDDLTFLRAQSTEPVDDVPATDAPTFEQTRAAADPAGVTDAASRGLDTARAVTGPTGVTDAVSAVFANNLSATIDDSIDVSNIRWTDREVYRTADDIVYSDSGDDTFTFDRAQVVDAPVAVTDAVVTDLTFGAVRNDPVHVSDALSYGGVLDQNPADMLDVTDQVVAASTVHPASEEVGVTDTISVVLVVSIILVDPMALFDAIYQLSFSAVDPADPVDVTDSVVVSGEPIPRPVTERTLCVSELGGVLLGTSGRARYIVHDPDSRLDYCWEWTRWLQPGETITLVSVATSDTSIASVPPQYIIDGVRVIAWVSGGVLGTRPSVTAHVTTTAGRRDDRTIPLYVRQR